MSCLGHLKNLFHIVDAVVGCFADSGEAYYHGHGRTYLKSLQLHFQFAERFCAGDYCLYFSYFEMGLQLQAQHVAVRRVRRHFSQLEGSPCCLSQRQAPCWQDDFRWADSR